MSKLDELIQELCPEGVEYKKISEVTNYEQPSKYIVKSTAYHDEYEIPVLTAGQSFVLGYTDESDGVYPASKATPVIIFDDFTAAFKWVVFPFKVKSSAMKIITAKEDSLLIRFLFHWMGVLNYSSTEHTRLWIGTYSKFRIPVPPLPVQREIVRILDNFAELTEGLNRELAAELTARKKQYAYYQDKLLDKPHSSTKIITIGELGSWSGGKTPSMDNSDYWEDGTMPWITSKDMKVSTLEDTEDHITTKAIKEASMTVYPSNGIAVVTRSGILKHTLPVAYVPFETTVNQDIKMLTVRTGILPRYAFHTIQGKSKDILATTKKQGGTVDSLEFKKFLDYKIPLPSLEVQQRLVEVLDNFDSICTDLNIGLPAEIEARQKQYEFYRDRLLTFAAQGETILTDRQTDRQKNIMH